jgi:hypothetical protein
VEERVEQSAADAVLREFVEFDRQRVLVVVVVVPDRDPEAAAQERAHRLLHEAHKVVEFHHGPGNVGQRARTEASRRRARASSARAPASVGASKPHGVPLRSSPGVKLRGGARFLTAISHGGASFLDFLAHFWRT